MLSESGARATIAAGFGGPILAEFNDPPYHQLYSVIADLGPTVIGCEFFQDIDEVNGLRPPDFRVYMATRGWLSRNTWQTWRNVVHAAMRLNRLDVADSAARVAFELMAIEHRMLDLCRAYANQLRPLVIQREIEEYKRFGDMYSNNVLNCIHSLFYELAVLRDYLAEFFANHVLDVKASNGKKISKMASLRRALISKTIKDDLCDEIIKVTDTEGSEPGWLAIMSAYRDLFTHVSPLEQATHRGFAVQLMIELKGGLRLPNLYHPLPPDVLRLVQSRSQGLPFAKFEEWAKASAKHKPTKETQPDALEYLHSTFNQLVGLAHQIVIRSPIAPEQIHLTKKDLVGPVVIKDRS